MSTTIGRIEVLPPSIDAEVSRHDWKVTQMKPDSTKPVGVPASPRLGG
jgi:hypothetical protein